MSRIQGTHAGVARRPTLFKCGRGKSLLPTVLLSVLLCILIASCATETLTLEERAQSIDQRLMCPVCPAETIDQSQADVAIQMRELVREKLQAGETEDQIFNFFVERYDKGVLAEPPAEGFNILVWVIPPVVLLLGLTLLWLGIRQLGRSPRQYFLTPEESWTADSERYLREVDEEFEAYRRSPTAPRQGI